MTLFFFHLRGGPAGLSRDDVGVDFPDAETAYLEAHQAAKDMAREWLKQGRNPRGYAFEIENASGELVLELPFAEALDHGAGRRLMSLSRAIRTAKERGERMMRLTAEVTREVEAIRENLRHSQELLQRTDGVGLEPRS